ncbi:unnamed protein product, partial [Mesorhabditis belari]|uniref:Uncharacterized protein n=1 Tax=Mesorhabditis belari TaxID=2138241 RepID=A0AAF3EQZ4_9BILA
MAATIRDNFCSLNRMEIPRPKMQGFQWVQTRGRQGFYKTIRANAPKYGLPDIKPPGPRRGVLGEDLFRNSRPETVKEEDSDGTISPPQPTYRQNRGANSSTDRSSTSSQLSSDSSRRSSPDPEPDYPMDYVPPQFPPLRHSPPRLPSSKSGQIVRKF